MQKDRLPRHMYGIAVMLARKETDRASGSFII